jgi:hypothetical protein
VCAEYCGEISFSPLFPPILGRKCYFAAIGELEIEPASEEVCRADKIGHGETIFLELVAQGLWGNTQGFGKLSMRRASERKQSLDLCTDQICITP